MNRRVFLRGAGGGSVAALFGSGAPAAPEAEGRGPFLDREQLRDRNSNRSTVVCQDGMVCTSQPLASMAGIEALKAGGNCVDAAIAANAVLGVTEPASNGIGGDLFAILWHEKEGRLFGLNASGRSPYAWSLEKARERRLESIPRHSPLAWSVPGCVSGWKALSERFGSLPLGRCLEAGIHYAADGFPAGRRPSTRGRSPSASSRSRRSWAG
jgi:gamma-glutamyltranspeptidase